MTAQGERPVRLTRHARNRMRSALIRSHGVTEEFVVATALNPDAVTLSVNGRVNHWKPHGQFWLRVTVVLEPIETVVITVTLKSRGLETGANDEDVL